ncbi:aldo/keto reductase [candidate division CSSED10-310 bacterium]|uniref:Aldo/keto reductase n=1 Tax=candidate division CSSED10-310 bacterium TaxID=2855610 RepID=A0ABV6YYP7_UNCC1
MVKMSTEKEPHGKRKMTRKEFLTESTSGLIGLFLATKTSSLQAGSDKPASKSDAPFRTLGKTGVNVSPMGFGASRTMEPALLKMALDKGINFIDTGRSYARGQNEVMVGDVVKGIRNKLIIQSKVKVRIKKTGDALHSPEMRQKISDLMEKSLSESLKALQTDYIDVLLLHGADSVEMLCHETVLDFFSRAKKRGQIRACGFSSHKNQVALLQAAHQNGFYDVAMVPFNHKGSYIHSRAGYYTEWDQAALIQQCLQAEKKGMGIIAMKTCSAGPYSADSKTAPTFPAGLRWILNHSFINTMAVAMANVKEIKENLLAISLPVAEG